MNIINKLIILLPNLLGKMAGRKIFVLYFDEVTNIGDVLNVSLIEHYSKKQVVKPPALQHFRHYLAVGSIIQSMNHNSIVLGSGLIDPKLLENIKAHGDIRAVRGKLTKQHIEQKFGITLDVPLGDAALLYPRIYNPDTIITHEFGLVLHYVDEDHPIKEVVEKMGGRIISVRQYPNSFIDEIKSCKKILSSSMHGLILADAYKIPNKRLILSDKIVGGDFKFSDYYSTTDTPNEQGVAVDKLIDEESVTDILTTSKVKHYIADLNHLEEIFINLDK